MLLSLKLKRHKLKENYVHFKIYVYGWKAEKSVCCLEQTECISLSHLKGCLVCGKMVFPDTNKG